MSDTLLDKILAEGIYNAGDEVAVMVNGLGATPLQELFFVFLKSCLCVFLQAFDNLQLVGLYELV